MSDSLKVPTSHSAKSTEGDPPRASSKSTRGGGGVVERSRRRGPSSGVDRRREDTTTEQQASVEERTEQVVIPTVEGSHQSPHSPVASQPTASSKDDLLQLIGVLSDAECRHLIPIVNDVAAGDRFWEDDIGVFYNEYVKPRYHTVARNPSILGTTGVLSGEDIYAPISITKSYNNSAITTLPTPQRIDTPLTEALMHRRSHRRYTGGAISPVELSTILEHSCGITGSVSAYGYNHLPLRPFPSCGALQSPEVYLFIINVDGISPGLYHYNYIRRHLEVINQGDHRSMLNIVVPAQPDIEMSSVVFVVTGCYERLRWKYGSLSYRYMCMDIGFIGENFNLVVSAMGLGFCAIAGFIEDSIEELVGVNGKDEMVLLLASVGVL